MNLAVKDDFNPNPTSLEIFWGKLYKELGLASPLLYQWYRRLSCFSMIYKDQYSRYLFNLIPTHKET